MLKEVLLLVLPHQTRRTHPVSPILKMKQMVKEGGAVGVEPRNLNFRLPQRLTLSVLRLDEFRLTLNKLRLLYGNLIRKKELRKTFYLDLIMIE